MVDVNQIMYNMIKKSNSIETSSVNEIEEIVDTGLDKTDENVQKMAAEYLDEKGYSRSPQNLDQAKQHILESSAGSETVRVRKRRTMVEDLLEDMEEEDMSKIMQSCLLDNMIRINSKLDVPASVMNTLLRSLTRSHWTAKSLRDLLSNSYHSRDCSINMRQQVIVL